MKIEHAPSVLAILNVQCALQDLIESEGMSTFCFDSAEQFLASAARHQASCLIADIAMPGMSGIELQARLRVEECGMPIIFVTARGDIPLAASAMKEGASDFFAKPLPMRLDGRLKSFRSAAITLSGIELAHRIRKRQFSLGRGR
jgi:FixJ family two-component response regulator